jgi:SIR2-like protein
VIRGRARPDTPGGPAEPKKKIVYLFGAGATHAELANLDPSLIESEMGLLVQDVSKRVINEARRHPRYLKNLEMVSGTSGSLNIELLISLIENSKINGWEEKTRLLRKLVQADIETILTESRKKRFYLHNGLIEFHKHALTCAKEELIGLISLNYDDVLDRAYQEKYGSPNYCFSLGAGMPSPESVPLLKLHGSFNWKKRKMPGLRRTIEIIPLGANKTYLHVPYGAIWNRALKTLIDCDTLRVVGCSLSQNDAHLIDLLFKAHLERDAGFDVEIISSEETGIQIRKNYGFFPKIRTILELEEHLVPDRNPDNPFKAWLKYKSIAILKGDIKATRYLRNVVR